MTDFRTNRFIISSIVLDRGDVDFKTKTITIIKKNQKKISFSFSFIVDWRLLNIIFLAQNSQIIKSYCCVNWQRIQ